MDFKKEKEKELILRLMKENYEYNPREEKKIIDEMMKNYDLGEGSLDQEGHLIELIDDVGSNILKKTSKEKIIDKVKLKLNKK